MLSAAVSGSFHRHMDAITSAVHELAALRVRVLSPADPRIVAQQGEFLFVASDRVRSVRLVQDRHLESIRAANFLWLVCPDGYVGQSASLELGAAIMVGVPIFTTRQPLDVTLREYVTIVPTLKEALRIVATTHRQNRPEGFLINPQASLEEAHDILEGVGTLLVRRGTDTNVDSAAEVYRGIAALRATLRLPAYTH